MAGYTVDGRLDTQFGIGGKVTMSFSTVPGTLGPSVGMALGPSGTIVVTGSEPNPVLGNNAIVLAK